MIQLKKYSMAVLIFTLCGIIIASCKKKEDEPFIPGKIYTKIKYEGKLGARPGKGLNSGGDSLYTGFGNYITSVTPTIFTGKFITIRFQEDSVLNNMMELLNNNLSYTDPLRNADFTGNSVVTLVPSLYGDIINEGASFRNSVRFKYFYFMLEYFYQEVNLPAQYAGIDTLNQFLGASTFPGANHTYAQLSNNILKARYRMLLYPVFQNGVQLVPDLFVFGNADSTYIHTPTVMGHTKDNPMGGGSSNPILRSHRYTPITFDPPADGQKNTTINATMSFDYKDLIQIYAGQDNIPYTKDDVFLYAPDFWERLSVQVSIE